MCDIKKEKYIDEIKKNIEEKMKKLFEEAHKYTENLSHEDIIRLHENHIKDVAYAYINNIPSLKKLVEEKGREDVLKEVKDKFMRNFHFHEKMVKCHEFRDNRETKYTKEELIENDKKISKYIHELTTSIIQECKELSIEEIKEIHIFIFKLIFDSDIKHIQCFKKASETMNMDVVNRIHDRKVTESINNYIDLWE